MIRRLIDHKNEFETIQLIFGKYLVSFQILQYISVVLVLGSIVLWKRLEKNWKNQGIPKLLMILIILQMANIKLLSSSKFYKLGETDILESSAAVSSQRLLAVAITATSR